MHMPSLWQRPTLQLPDSFDTIFFDVDGILIKTTASYHATDLAVVAHVTGTLNGLDWGQQVGEPLLTIHDVDAFKRAGGYNNDMDMCYLLAALTTARLREWKGTELAGRSSEQWAALSRTANLQGHGGRAWVEATFPHSSLPDYSVVRELCNEYYWGTDELRKRFGHEPRYLPTAQGLFQREEMLYAPDFPQRLRAAGIAHLGMITGRIGPEVDSALERMAAYSGTQWWDVVIPADVCPKPNPRALRLAIEAVGARGGLYIGDTADDHDLIRNYMATRTASEPPFLAAVSVNEDEIALYQERGVDMIARSVEDILLCLPNGRTLNKIIRPPTHGDRKGSPLL